MGKFILNKAASGGYNLLGAFSNRWRDWDFHADPEHGGEIVASKAHEEFMEWLDKNPHHAPELWTWHAWGSARKNRASWWAWSDNFMYANWPLTEDEGNAIGEWAAKEELGMSFGFYVLKYDWQGGVIERYRAFEASVLPVKHAANKWTKIILAPATEPNKGAKMTISKEKFTALVALHGEEFANQLVQADKELGELLDAAGVETKEESAEGGEQAAPVEETVTEVTEEPAITVEYAKSEEVVDAFRRLEGAVGESVQTLAERLSALEAEVKTLKSEREAEAKAAAMPPSILASYSPRSILDRGKEEGGNAAVVDGRSALAKSGPAAPPNNHISALLGDIRR